MTTHLGLGVMLRHLCGNTDTVNAIKESFGKKIVGLKLEDNKLYMTFADKTGIYFWDNGQSCCEHRYMHTDDDLEYHVGGKFKDVEVADGPEGEDQYGEMKECQFLKITTTKGVFTMANYNEHNGYYGGFAIEAVRC